MKDKTESGRIVAVKDKTYEGQHHGIEEIILKYNCYYVGVGDIGKERRLGRDVGQPCPNGVGREVESFKGQRRLSHRTGSLYTKYVD
jgi:hypothetical protein